jgi:hypothetical protein
VAAIRELGPADPVKEPNHVLVVKHDDGRFEVSGTVGAGEPDAHYLTPAPFADKEDAMVCAVSFADAYGLPTVFVKGFRADALPDGSP